ncbi:MAG TPA: DUF559 domain-containing protein [Candidatus Paceibacterota bacterium]
MTKISSKQNVLVTVVKSKRDLNLILKEGWYRIPLKYAPKQKFKYLAFYGPISGNLGGKITYYANIKKITRATRRDLLPKEVSHPRIHNLYLHFELRKIFKLPKPIRNKSRRRVSFGFTTLSLLKKAGDPNYSRRAGDILDLYGVPPIEEIFEKALKGLKIKYVREYTISKNGKKYRLDFAIFPPALTCGEPACPESACGEPVESVEWVEPISSKSGLISSKQKIAIECDGAKSHSLLSQKIRDRAKDKFLRRAGWKILRFTEKEIMEKADGPEGSRGIDACILKLKSLLDKGEPFVPLKFVF